MKMNMNIIEKLNYQEMLVFLETPFNKYEFTVMLIIGGLFLFFSIVLLLLFFADKDKIKGGPHSFCCEFGCFSLLLSCLSFYLFFDSYPQYQKQKEVVQSINLKLGTNLELQNVKEYLCINLPANYNIKENKLYDESKAKTTIDIVNLYEKIHSDNRRFCGRYY